MHRQRNQPGVHQTSCSHWQQQRAFVSFSSLPSSTRTAEQTEPAEPRRRTGRITLGRCHISSLLLLPGRAEPGRATLQQGVGGKMGLAFCAQGAASSRFSAASAPNDARTDGSAVVVVEKAEVGGQEGGWARFSLVLIHLHVTV